jgi:hypothetical protein
VDAPTHGLQPFVCGFCILTGNDFAGLRFELRTDGNRGCGDDLAKKQNLSILVLFGIELIGLEQTRNQVLLHKREFQ